MPHKADQERAPDREREFEEVVSRHEAMLLRYTARIVSDPDAAQDIVQNVFIKLFRSWKESMDVSPQLSSWLYRVAHNEAVDYLRKRERRRLLHWRHAAEQPVVEPVTAASRPGISEAAARADMLLDSLTLRERQLVVLKVYEEKSYKEIGDITGLSVGNVGYILHHAMKKLATWHGETPPAPGGGGNDGVSR